MERIVFDKMKSLGVDHFVLNLHLQFYVFAHRYIHKKTILDAACGTGFGSMMFSTAARSIIAVDKSQKAMDYGKAKLPFFCPIKFMKADLNKDILPQADTCVSLETIEHLNYDGFFLRNLKTKHLVFSVPLNMPKGHFHKIIFKSTDEVIGYLKDSGWNTTFIAVGQNDSMLGTADRIHGWKNTKNNEN